MHINKSLFFTFIGYSLTLVYYVFLVMYLTNAKKTDIYMSQQDQTFRQVAVVITWICIALISLGLVGVIGTSFGIKMGRFGR